MSHAAQDFDAVALNLHATAAPVAPLATLKLSVHQPDIDGEPRGQTLDYRDERASVRLTCRVEAEHWKK